MLICVYRAQLEEHQRNSARQGNYVEAEMAKNRIDEYKMQEGSKLLENWTLKQMQDAATLDENQLNDQQQFHVKWEQRISEKEQENARILAEF